MNPEEQPTQWFYTSPRPLLDALERLVWEGYPFSVEPWPFDVWRIEAKARAIAYLRTHVPGGHGDGDPRRRGEDV